MAVPTALPVRATVAPAAAADTYYVDPSIGNDANTTTQARSPSTPWATLDGALQKVPIKAAGSNAPTDIVIYGTDADNGGTTTRGFTITKTGPGSACPASFQWTSVYALPARIAFPVDSPLRIKNAPGTRVLFGGPIRFNYTATYVSFRATRVGGQKGIVVDTRFPSGSTTNSGVGSNGSLHCELYGLEIRNNCWNNLGGGVYIGAWSLSGVDQSSTDFQMWNCYVHHNGGAVQGAHGGYYGGTSGTELVGSVGGCVVNCQFLWNQDDNFAPHNNAQSLVIAHSLFLGYGGGGLAGSGVSTTPLTDSGITRGWSDGITFFGAPSGQPNSANNLVVNCILAFTPAYGLNQYDTSSGGGNVERSNVYFGSGAGARRDASNTWQFLSTMTSTDPLFLSYTKGDPNSDFHLLSTSPCGSAGNAAYTPTFDFDDNPRSNSDIGPYDVSSTGTGGGGGSGGGSGSTYPLTVGDANQGLTVDSGYTAAYAACQVAVPTGGMTVYEIRCWVQTFSGAPTVRAGIYSDVSGAPNSRLMLTADQVLPVSLIQQVLFTITPFSLAAGFYWPALGVDTVSPSMAMMASAGTHVYVLGSGALPATFSATPTTSTLVDMPISLHGISNLTGASVVLGSRMLLGVGI